MIESCKKEIIELHRFFEDWFCARLPDTDEAFNRLVQCLAEEFEMITPEANIIKRSSLLKQLRSMNGAYLDEDKPSAIWIKNTTGRMISDDLCLMRYEEWQGESDHSKARGRRSSALFQKASEAPTGVQWLHLHEVWIT